MFVASSTSEKSVPILMTKLIREIREIRENKDTKTIKNLIKTCYTVNTRFC